jgi:hypothetical protein
LKRRFSVNRRNRTGSVSQLGRRRLLQSHCLLSAQSNQQQQNAGGFSPQILIKSREGICSSQAAQMDPLEDGEAGAGGSTECCAASPFSWLRRLSRELHWSFVLAVVAVYGACQGVGNAVGGAAAGYYWKGVQRVQPSAVQFYQGLTDAPWVIKPLWGLLTDIVPVAGFRRRPYFVLAGQRSELPWFCRIGRASQCVMLLCIANMQA